MRFLAFATLAPPAIALRISNIAHSGPACPSSSDIDITATDSLPVLSLSVPGFNASADTGNTSACGISLTIEDGEVGQSLVLESVEVWGRLGLSAGARGRLLTAAYWSEDAEVLQTSRQNTSTARPFSNYIFVNSALDLPSTCVGRDGYVGILNISFRVVSNGGEVTFGPQQASGRTVPVSEHLGLRWDECEEREVDDVTGERR